MQAVKETLDKCLACKGCKAECPSAVDMAKLKYEFIAYYYSQKKHLRPLRDYLFGYISQIARVGHIFPRVANIFLDSRRLAGIRESLLGIDRHRKLPLITRASLHHRLQDNY